MKKHTKFSILHFALAASVSLLVVLAAPAGANFFAQVLVGPAVPSCPGGITQMFCTSLQRCAQVTECNAADSGTGIMVTPPAQPDSSGSCQAPNMICAALNFQCVSGEQCQAGAGGLFAPQPSNTMTQSTTFTGGCPAGQFQCASLNNQCATFADCDAADKSKLGSNPGPTTPTTNAATSCTPPKDICAALNFQCVTIDQCNAAQPFTGPISPFNNLNSASVSTDNPFDVSTFGDKKINIPKLPSSMDLKNTKTLNTLITKTTKTKSNEEAMGKILSITQALSDTCDSSNLKCAGRDKLSTLIEEAAFDGLDSKNMKKIKKAFENFAKAVNKEYAKSQKSSAKKKK